MITRAEQDYIKAILKLQEHSADVSTSSLAITLGVTAASVSGMLKKLTKEKMIRYRQYKGVRLTEKGRRAALDVLRRHRLIELFLIEVLNMTWDSVHDEAERLEHVISDEMVAKIDELLNYPKYDPHGAPIPSQTGECSPTNGEPLNRMKVGQSGVICEVEDGDPAMLQHLKKIGLVLGVSVTLDEALAVDGTLRIKRKKRVMNISAKVASVVRVEIANNDSNLLQGKTTGSATARRRCKTK